MRIFRFVIAIALLSLIGCRKEVEQLTEIVSLSQSHKTALERIIDASKSNLEVDAIQYVEKSNKYIVTLSDGNSTHIELYNGQGDFQYESLYFESITIEANGVMFMLTDGSQIFLPFNRRISLTFEEYDLSMARSGSTATICYTLKSAFEVDSFDIYCSTDVVVENNSYNAKTQQGELSVVIPQRVNSSSKLVVVASNGQCATMAAIRFESTRAYSFNNSIKSPATSGGEYVLEYIAGAECSVTISEQGQSWISQNCNADGVVISVSANNDYYRTAQVILSQPDGACEIVYTINQDGKKGVYMNPDDMPDNEIWYTTTDGQIMTPSVAATFGAKIVSNRMESGKGVLQFDGAVTRLSDNGFDGCTTLQRLVIPKSVEYISRASFAGCSALETIYGKYASDDGRAVVVDNTLIYYLVNCGLSYYTLPKDVVKVAESAFEGSKLQGVVMSQSLHQIGFRAFAACDKLREVSIPDSVTEIGAEAFADCTRLSIVELGQGVETLPYRMFNNCPSLQKFTGQTAIMDGVAAAIDGRLIVVVNTYSNKTFTIPNYINSVAPLAFAYTDMEIIIFENPDIIIEEGVFGCCANLREVRGSKYLSGSGDRLIIDGTLIWTKVNSTNQLKIDDAVARIGSYAFGGIDVKKIIIPKSVKSIGSYAFANAQTRNLIIHTEQPPIVEENSFEASSMTITVPDKALTTYQNHPIFSRQNLFGIYFSSDYSRHEEVVVIQQATEGVGLDIIFMGEGYTDKDVASGDYDRLMRQAADAFFSIEPYASFRHLFNVCYVTIVSANGAVDNCSDTFFGGYLYSSPNWVGELLSCEYESLARDYAKEAIGSVQAARGEYCVGVLLNLSEGRSNCSWVIKNTDYGSGSSISLCQVGDSDSEYFEYLIHHEMGGHGFAKLDDEYVEYSGETFYGGLTLYKNVDTCSDPNLVKWSHFLKDSRYDVEGLGVFEGAAYYSYGAYRPSEDSIMRGQDKYFNAPSREAIYYSIHKKAFGESWRYNYEDFVAFDAKVLAAKPWVQSWVMGHTMVLRPQELGAPPRLIKEDDEL